MVEALGPLGCDGFELIFALTAGVAEPIAPSADVDGDMVEALGPLGCAGLVLIFALFLGAADCDPTTGGNGNSVSCTSVSSIVPQH